MANIAATWRGGWPALAILVTVTLLFRLPPGGSVFPAQGDVPAYLTGAYHLSHDHLYSTSRRAGAAAPELGREPGYPIFLAALMEADPTFGGVTPDCLKSNAACPAAMFRAPHLANAGFILAAGVALFILGRMLTGGAPGGLIAAAYLLLNAHANKDWGDLMSDRFAVLVLSLAMIALCRAWQAGKSWRWALAGAALAALVLTKAIFLYWCIAAWGAAAAVMLIRRRAQPTALLMTACVFIVLVGGWTYRNWQVSGEPRLTDARSGIALSTRAVFDTMTPREYAASLVFWTGSKGPKLAARWFGEKLAAQFDLGTPGGYYDIGQNRYGREVAAVMDHDHLPYWQAVRREDARIIAGIRTHPGAYLATGLPLTYRGLWVDEFVLIGIPCLILACWRALRRADGLMLVLLSIGVFNILAYAAVSLNIERYQLTALPAISLAVATVAAGRRGATADITGSLAARVS